MASYLTGPAAHLVGSGMQMIGIGIPVGPKCNKVIENMREYGLPVPPKSWFKCKSDQENYERDVGGSKKTVYDKLESHLNGLLQVAKPAMELRNIVQSASTSNNNCTDGSCTKEQFKFYTPQKLSTGGCKNPRNCKSASLEKKSKINCLDCRSRNEIKKLNCKKNLDIDEWCDCNSSDSETELPDSTYGHNLLNTYVKPKDRDVKFKYSKNKL